MSRRSVEKMLTGSPAPPPPEGLAERIKSEIPERLELAEGLTEEQHPDAPHRTTWYLAAAATLLLGLTAAVTWQLRSSGPDARLAERMGEPPAATAGARTTAPAEEPVQRRAEAEKVVAAAPPPAARSRLDEVARELPATGPPVGATQRSRAANEGPRLEEATPRAADLAKKETREHEAASRDKAAGEQVRPRPGNLEGSTGRLEAPGAQAAPGESKRQLVGDESLALGTAAAPAPSPPSTGGHDKRVVVPPGPALASQGLSEARTDGATPATVGTGEPHDRPIGDLFSGRAGANPFVDTEDHHLSTFGLHVDTASYTLIRRSLRDGHLPPPEAVRVEEVVNALSYGDPPPRRGDFALTAEGAPTPFAEGPGWALLRFAVTARQTSAAHRPSAVLTVAREARTEVDFNPSTVARYRLLGYENRDIADERFRNPSVDAGEVGAGHTVTALYEVELQPHVSRRDPSPLATLRLRWRPADGGGQQEIQRALTVHDLAPSWEAADPALRLAALAARFAEVLQDSSRAREGDLGEVLRRAQELAPAFAGDARMADFVDLVAAAAELQGPARADQD